jgi:hypothetical protein
MSYPEFFGTAFLCVIQAKSKGRELYDIEESF